MASGQIGEVGVGEPWIWDFMGGNEFACAADVFETGTSEDSAR